MRRLAPHARWLHSGRIRRTAGVSASESARPCALHARPCGRFGVCMRWKSSRKRASAGLTEKSRSHSLEHRDTTWSPQRSDAQKGAAQHDRHIRSPDLGAGRSLARAGHA
jgi:hypothetical protein